MNASLVQCPQCQAWLLDGAFNQSELSPCPACGVPLQVEIFPALFRQFAPGQSGEAILVEGEAACFYHPQKKAVVPCQGCGRFLCALCDCELSGQHFCPMCLEAGKSRGKIKNLENQRVRYDNIALALAIFPILIFYFTLVTAPISLFVALRHWKAPGSLVHRTRVRYVVAIILAVAQIAGWGVFLIYLVSRYTS